jgi:hypothetical protein
MERADLKVRIKFAGARRLRRGGFDMAQLSRLMAGGGWRAGGGAAACTAACAGRCGQRRSCMR